MPAAHELREKIVAALGAFASAPLFDAAIGLFDTLGYRSERRLRLRSATAEGFFGTFDRAKTLNRGRALLDDWKMVEFLFQLTDAEVKSAALGADELPFDSRGAFDDSEINSYLFLAIELSRGAYTRTELAGATNLWRYRSLLSNPERAENLLRDHIPFVNGGLFDCFDQVYREEEGREDVRLDDFSEEKDNGLCLPNELFFDLTGEEHRVDLSEAYGDSRRGREVVHGLIDILSRYKFTVEENTPLEEEIALDPELLGKVFENLLASYNEDTKTTARKALGGFYTPREIVSYMVDEALIACLVTKLVAAFENQKAKIGNVEPRLRTLFSVHAHDFANPFTPVETVAPVAAIGRVKILDPACGSGAFPMGALHRLVDLLQKLDPNNESWKRDRLAEAERYCEVLRAADAPKDEIADCEARVADIRRSFDTRFHALDFARKLYLIENGIYGVDIQPIATQIAKLRFFIALLVDQHVDRAAPNLGVRPLPNLETKIVAADSLVPIEKPDGQMDLLDMEVRPLRRELEKVRHDHFNARTPARKQRCRVRDAELRARLADLLRQNGLPADSARALAGWDPLRPKPRRAVFRFRVDVRPRQPGRCSGRLAQG